MKQNSLKNHQVRTPLLKCNDLSIGYGEGKKKRIIQGHLSLKLFTGELVCLLGPNGVGKSTLLRTLCGLQPALSGQIFLEGKALQSFSRHDLSLKVSTVLTDQVIVEHMQVYDLVAMGRYPHTGYFGRTTVLDREIIDESIELVGIEALKDRFLDELSDGERQKVMIARALAQETPFIILDEPMAFLDFPSKLDLIRILRKLVEDHGKGILLTTHDLNISIQSADWIWLIGDKQRIKKGVPEDLILRGDFATFFDKGDIRFDNTTGEFRMVTTQMKKVYLSGDGSNANWVKKALQRKGYQVLNGKQGRAQITVTDDPDLKIIIRSNEKEIIVNSIRDLLFNLK